MTRRRKKLNLRKIARELDWLRLGALIAAGLAWLFIHNSLYAFFLDILLLWWVFRLDSRILGGIALFFLVLIPALLALDRDATAEIFAVYVFFLLSITVLLQIIELWEYPHGVPEDEQIAFPDLREFSQIRTFILSTLLGGFFTPHRSRAEKRRDAPRGSRVADQVRDEPPHQPARTPPMRDIVPAPGKHNGRQSRGARGHTVQLRTRRPRR